MNECISFFAIESCVLTTSFSPDVNKKEARGGQPLGAPPGFGAVPGGGLNSVFAEPVGFPRVNVESPCGARGGEPGGVTPGASEPRSGELLYRRFLTTTYRVRTVTTVLHCNIILMLYSKQVYRRTAS